jgi:hypothetical protein
MRLLPEGVNIESGGALRQLVFQGRQATVVHPLRPKQVTIRAGSKLQSVARLDSQCIQDSRGKGDLPFGGDSDMHVNVLLTNNFLV